MNNPLDINAFSYWLRFNSLNKSDWFQICEPIGIDGAQFTKEQNAKGWSRDVEFFAIDKIKFVDAFGAYIENAQQINPQGDTSNYLNYGLNWILYIWKNYSFESDVDFLIKKDNVSFKEFQLDFTENDITDGYTYLECKLIEKGKVAEIKLNQEASFNAFATKDVNGNEIQPVQTFNYLLKAIPIEKSSKWIAGTKIFDTGGLADYFTPFSKIDSGSNIDYTLLSLYDKIDWNLTGDDPSTNLRLFRAKNTITNVKVKLHLKIKATYQSVSGNPSFSAVRCFKYSDNYTSLPDGVTNLLTYNVSNSSPIYENEIDIEIDYPIMYQNETIYFHVFGQSVYGDITLQDYSGSYVEIIATETAINKVIKAVRYIDFIKQSLKSVNDLPINTTIFNSISRLYNQAVFCRRMISGKTDYFYSSIKDCLASLNEINFDIEFNENEAFLGHQKDYYINQEIASFLTIPSIDATQSSNEKYKLNLFRIKNKTFEQDRTSENTSKSTHTESEWSIKNKKVNTIKEVSIEFVRDPLARQSMVNIETKTPTTSTEEDDKVYIEEFTTIAPTDKGLVERILLMRFIDGKLEILNRYSDEDISDVFFTWNTIGLEVGSFLNITNGVNLGSYVVSEIEPNLIKLTPISASVTEIGDHFLRIEFNYQNVQYKTLTTQGFSLVEGVIEGYSNLNFTQKRIMLDWFNEYLATTTLRNKKDIENNKFKNNGNVKTQRVGEEIVIENAPILYNSLTTPLTTDVIDKVTLVADWIEMYNYLTIYKTTRGFIRCYDYLGNVIKGFPKKLKHNHLTNELNVDIERIYETESLIINGTQGNLYINNSPYDLSGIIDWWKFENDFFTIYDEKSKPITNKIEFNYVILNDVSFSTKEALIEALILLNE